MSIDDSRDLNRLRSDLSMMSSQLDRRFVELAGDNLPKILLSKSSAESYLTHAEKSCRIAALWALSYLWPQNQVTRELFEKTAVYDQDTEVRAMATANL